MNLEYVESLTRYELLEEMQHLPINSITYLRCFYRLKELTERYGIQEVEENEER